MQSSSSEATVSARPHLSYDGLTLSEDGGRFVLRHRALSREQCDVNFAERQFAVNPYPVYEWLRERLPVHRHRLGFWVFTRHQDCVAVVKNSREWSSDTRNAGTEDFFTEPSESWPGDQVIYPHLFGEPPRAMSTRPFIFVDEPDHKRLRALVGKAFTRSTLTPYQPRLEELVATMLEAALDNDEINFVGDFAYLLPVTVICELLGVPVEDHPLFREWSRPLIHALDPAFMLTARQREASRAALLAIIQYLTQLIASRRGELRDDLLGTLIAAEQDGEKLTEAEVVSTVLLLLIAGHETTVNLICNGLLALLAHPEQAELLLARPDVSRQAVDETLRFDSPIQILARTLLCDSEVDGHQIAAGEHAVLLVGAANRDPAIFERPDSYELDRGNANRHLAFGTGIHACIGSPLARMEGQAVLPALAAVVPQLEFAVPPVYRSRILMRGPDVIMLRHRRGRRTAMPAADGPAVAEPAAGASRATRLLARGISLEFGSARTAGAPDAPTLYPTEAVDPWCLRSEEFDLLLDGARWRRIVSVGDSSIEGLGDPVDGYQTHSFIERLIGALRRCQPNLRHLNLGTRDLTAAQVRAEQLERAVAFRPHLAIMIAGGNDMFPPEWDPDSVERELEVMARSLRDTGSDLVMVTYMNPVNAVPMFKGTPLDDRMPQLNDRVRRVAGRHGAILVELENSPASFIVDVYSHDFKHATMRGHAIVAADFAKAIFAHLHPDIAAQLGELATASAPSPRPGTPHPSTPLVYGGTMDPQRLQSLPIFADVPATALEQIAMYAGERGVPAGEPLIQQGDYSHELICIERGTAEVVRDGRMIAQLGPGSVVGEIGLLRRVKRTASVIVTSPARIITLTSWDLNRLPARVVDRLDALMEERLRDVPPTTSAAVTDNGSSRSGAGQAPDAAVVQRS